METSLNKLTILYTQHIRGDLQLLPRLYTFLQMLKSQADGLTLLLDLGDSCVQDVWHCQVTGGRSTLMVMDSMGYQVANVEGLLNMPQRLKIQDIVAMGLVDRTHHWQYQQTGIYAVYSPTEEVDTFQLCLKSADETILIDNQLYFASVESHQVGIVQVALEDTTPRILSTEILTIPTDSLPNPTISATVDFVEDEARYYAKNQPKS